MYLCFVIAYADWRSSWNLDYIAIVLEELTQDETLDISAKLWAKPRPLLIATFFAKQNYTTKATKSKIKANNFILTDSWTFSIWISKLTFRPSKQRMSSIEVYVFQRWFISFLITKKSFLHFLQNELGI